MSVRKRKWTSRSGEEKTAWIVDYTDQNGKRHIETFQRKKAADDREAKVRVNVKDGKHVVPSESITVAQAADRWLKRVEADGMRGEGAVEQATLKQYKEHVKLHIVPHIGGVKLAKLTPEAVENFRSQLLAKDATGEPVMSRVMARKVWISFKSLLKVAGYSHVATDVAIHISKRDRRVLKVGVDIPEPDEINRLIKAAKAKSSKLHALLMTVAFTGLRASELRGLRWSDIELQHPACLNVRQRADRRNKIGPPKSEASIRTLPLSDELVSALRHWKLPCPKGDLVFPTRTGRIQHHKNMLLSLAPVMRAAGVVTKDGEPKYALHAFRHFFASWCLNSQDRGGCELPAKEAQTLLGHSSIAMTMDIYSHLFPENKNVRDKLAAASQTLLGGMAS